MESVPKMTRLAGSDRHSADTHDAAGSVTELIEQVLGVLRRQYKIVVVAPVCTIAISIAYLTVTPPQYTATATLMIDSSKSKGLAGQLSTPTDYASDIPLVESQAEILKSKKIALAVINELHLAEASEGSREDRGPLRTVLASLGWRASEARPEAEAVEAALARFLAARTVARIGKTYVLEISYTSPGPEQAAAVANAMAEAYIDDQLEAKYQAIRRASVWMQDRIKELKAQALAANQAVLDYKEKKNIIDVGGQSGGAAEQGSPRLVNEQQLVELSTQLVNARVSTSEAKARLDRIESILKQDVGDATVAETFRSEVINSLRKTYLDLAGREASWSVRYGEDHAATVELRNKMQEIRRSIRDELVRIAAGSRSDYEIARTREENLQKALTELVSEGQSTNRDRLGLMDLESSAKSYRAIYDTFLQRYMEAIQQQSFPLTEARVIGAASPPLRKSKPVTSLVLAIGTTVGLVIGFGVATLREAFDSSFRSARQVEECLGGTCLCVLPSLRLDREKRGMKRRARWPFGTSSDDRPAGRPAARQPVAIGEGATPAINTASITDPAMQEAVRRPQSPFAEGIRAVKLAADLQSAIGRNRVIGVTSTIAGEGKSTVAFNLASQMADVGKRVILVDADLRNPKIAHCVASMPTTGLRDVVSGGVDLERAIVTDPGTGLDMLPALPERDFIHTDEVIASAGLRSLVDSLRARYDYVIVDLPPIAPVVDARVAAPLIDSFLFVIECGRTRIKTVQSHLAGAPQVNDSLLGFVLNKASPGRLDHFDQHGLYGRAVYYPGARDRG